MAGDGGDGGSSRVLVVEDEARLGELLRLELGQRGYRVGLASDGRQALERLAAADWDLVVLDVMLPEVDGVTVCRRIRRGELGRDGEDASAERARRLRELPVILLTARGEVSDRVAGLDAGADDYVSKPFYVEELLARMRAVLRRHEGRTEEVLQVGDLRLDPRARTATRAGVPLSLTRREFDLLAFLAENSPWVMTRDVMLERVWGYAYSGSSNIVDVMIRQLREKVERPSSQPLIHTVRGVGYVLRPPDGSA